VHLQFPISGGNTPRQLMLIKDFGTTVIACTPSYALNIADYIEKNMPDFKIEETRLRHRGFWCQSHGQRLCDRRLRSA
jgi:phenylacetate-CoA ligase